MRGRDESPIGGPRDYEPPDLEPMVDWVGIAVGVVLSIFVILGFLKGMELVLGFCIEIPQIQIIEKAPR